MKMIQRARAFMLGVLDGFEQGELQTGLTWSSPGDRPGEGGCSDAYDRGANVGERLARLAGKA